MRLCIAFLLACGLALASADCLQPPALTNCGTSGDAIQVSCVDAKPWPPVLGQDFSVTVSGSVKENITVGTYTVSVSFDGIPLIQQSGDICTLDPSFQCPFPAGPIHLSKSVAIPAEAPQGDYEIDLSAVGSSPSDSLMCFKVAVSIGGGQLRARPIRPQKPLYSEIQDDAPALNHEIMHYVNSIDTTWTAGPNKRFQDMTMSHVKTLCGTLVGGPTLPEKGSLRYLSKLVDIPDEFDSRTQWGDMCESIGHVRDQGSCGSCWAFGASEAMTDRICIASKGAQKPYLAAEDLVSCCTFICGMGCDGGFPAGAWSYWQLHGLVTGGDYNSGEGCYPYQVPACEHHVNGTLPPCGAEQSTPSCKQSCQNGADWASDKHYGASSYAVPSDVASIQTEIMTNGPVEAAFTVYADFPTYRSGVYQHVSGAALGGHAIKILGWGTENGTPYWTVANSWNGDWGDKGFFKILRGDDECGIESQIVAGLAKL